MLAKENRTYNKIDKIEQAFGNCGTHFDELI